MCNFKLYKLDNKLKYEYQVITFCNSECLQQVKAKDTPATFNDKVAELEFEWIAEGHSIFATILQGHQKHNNVRQQNQNYKASINKKQN